MHAITQLRCRRNAFCQPRSTTTAARRIWFREHRGGAPTALGVNTMKKITDSKLTLKTETLQQLTPSETAFVNGGAGKIDPATTVHELTDKRGSEYLCTCNCPKGQ